MYKLSAAILVALFVASSSSAALAQDAGDQNTGIQNANYQSAAPSWPQQAPQGYEQPQYDAYRGEAHMQTAPGGSNVDYSSRDDFPAQNAANGSGNKMTHGSDEPIKPQGSGKLKGAVGGLKRAVGHVAGPMSRVALPVAGYGAMYMVQRAAMRSAMMGSGYGYPGYGGGYGMPMGYGGYGGYGMRGFGW